MEDGGVEGGVLVGLEGDVEGAVVLGGVAVSLGPVGREGLLELLYFLEVFAGLSLGFA